MKRRRLYVRLDGGAVRVSPCILHTRNPGCAINCPGRSDLATIDRALALAATPEDV